jgi:hypothetical protein
MPGAIAQLPPQATYTDEPVYRLTVKKYHELIASGTLTSDDPVELIEGVLVFKMPKNEAHIAAIRRSRRALESMLPAGFFYDSEQPITLPDGEPEPDGMIVRGVIEDFDSVKVTPADAALVIEIADSTLGRDRGTKLRSYARAGVGCYWIINLVDRQIEVYTDPAADDEASGYRARSVFMPGDRVPLPFDGESWRLTVAELLPPG